MSAAKRRQQLVEIGRRIFAENGYDAATVEDIAAAAGVSKPVVYEHFGGKEGLYAVVCDRELAYLGAEITEALQGEGSRRRIERAAMALLRYVEDTERVFVHASIDPAIGNMEDQDDTMLLGARAPLAPAADLGAPYLVHGHFPQADGLPEILRHRCNLDTDGCRTGVFTCGIFDETQPDPVDIIQVR